MIVTNRPPDRETIAALRIVARVLGQDAAYVDGARFIFPLGGPWALALSADDAGRFRLGACYGATEVATLWALAADRRRLADLALGLRQEIDALAAQRG